jgi:hypothetical protein
MRRPAKGSAAGHRKALGKSSSFWRRVCQKFCAGRFHFPDQSVMCAAAPIG